MITQVRKDSKKKRVRKNKSHTVLERVYFYDEQGYIFRSESGGKFWSVSFWVPEEKKEYRKSLKTKDKVEALVRAKDTFLSVQGKIKNNIRVWDTSVSVLLEEYLEFQNIESEAGKKTKGRVGTIRSQLKHFSEFVGLNTKVNEIKDDDFLNYVSFRRKREPDVQNVTLINEKATFRNLLSFCQRKGYVSREKDWNFGVIPKQVSRRSMIDKPDLNTITRYLIYWDKKDDGKTKEQKFFIRSFILILSNTGIRFGEARRLQWKDIQTYDDYDEPTKTRHGKDVRNVRIELPYHKTKNKKHRICIGRRGDVFDNLKRFSNWTKPDDYIFVDNDTGKPIDRKVYYKLWNELIKGTQLDKSGKKYTYYCLRHTFATFKLNNGIDHISLSKILGCSVKFIEDHYGHVDVDKMRSRLTRNGNYDSNGNPIF